MIVLTSKAPLASSFRSTVLTFASAAVTNLIFQRTVGVPFSLVQCGVVSLVSAIMFAVWGAVWRGMSETTTAVRFVISTLGAAIVGSVLVMLCVTLSFRDFVDAPAWIWALGGVAMVTTGLGWWLGRRAAG